MKMILAFIAIASISACAIMPTANDHDINKVVSVGKTINSISTVLLNTVGPVAVANLCVAKPEACKEAQDDLSLAIVTNNEITTLLNSASEINAADGPAKLSVALISLRNNLGGINSLIVKYGGNPIDLSAFDAELGNLPASVPSGK